MSNSKTVLALHAHPDDAELGCGGTLALLREKGWQIEIATMTAGYCGSAEYILSMKNWAEQRGSEINAEYAEDFRQHLGHAFPQDNILKSELGELVHER